MPAAPTHGSVPPSIHRRAIITWLAIFPAVLVGQIVLEPAVGDWPLLWRTLALTLLVVPAAVYVIVPRLMALNGRLASRRR